MSSYEAHDIEVLEGLEAVRRRPGMYIGGTDLRALHHLAAEILDNSMDEAVAGHADHIRVRLANDGSLTVSDNGRGIPVDPHPRYPDKSALEVILTVLHSGGKFNGKAYTTSGGLNGVGISVVNALSVWTEVVVERNGRRFRQRFARGLAATPLQPEENTRRHGTQVSFLPDPEVFPDTRFRASKILEMCRSKAYLNRGVEILVEIEEGDEKHRFHYPNGLADYIRNEVPKEELLTPEPFVGRVEKLGGGPGSLEWALTWSNNDEDRISSFCNAIPTPEGGTHETALRTALLRGIREYAEARKLLPAQLVITSEDVQTGLIAILSLFINEPQFSGQTKEKLTNPEALRLVDAAIKDHLDHWLHDRRAQAEQLVQTIIDRAQERINRKKASTTVKRKTAVARLTLPGKLTDCISSDTEKTEMFIVEGDSAGGSAKQARDRHFQAVLPLRGKILNVEQANLDRFEKNVEIQNLITAIGAGWGRHFDPKAMRYGRVIIMTDADVDGAHIASLLLTFFYRNMLEMIRAGRLFLAQPPLYKISVGAQSAYALDEMEREREVRRLTKGRSSTKVEISRFKGLGEMSPIQLRETTMAPNSRRMLKIFIDDPVLTDDTFDRLMGKRAVERFRFIQEKAPFAKDSLDI